MRDIDQLLASYPRKRPELSEQLARIYVQHYKENRGGESFISNLVSKWEHRYHRWIAKDSHDGMHLLEIGAGNLNHVPFEPESLNYDVIEPFHELYQDNPDTKKIRQFFDDISEIAPQIKDQTTIAPIYDRIISCAVLEHILDLPTLVAYSGVLLKDQGDFCAVIPNEGHFGWSFAYKMTTGIAFRLKTGHSYEEMMRHEHINLADEITAICSYFFTENSFKRDPLPIHPLGMYVLCKCAKPDREKCFDWLKKRLN